ncbi:hypothetical protein RND71_006088 [Anisodus tanguticus]|uniref:Uncharacterized protein n=1 Tax=Anisodus tanguticus TaxID=243964 RepID=A0AAE1SVG0_9SOLA|nr:hypothetical protein RND71_006088 [Anisodus tanguticus]
MTNPSSDMAINLSKDELKQGSSSRMKKKRGRSDEEEEHDVNSSAHQLTQEGDFDFMPTPRLPQQQQQQYKPFGPPTEIESDPDLRPKIIYEEFTRLRMRQAQRV